MQLQDYLTDEAILSELGSRIARLRIESDLTQEELANKSGISKPTVARLERGMPVQSTTLIRVFRTLKLLSSLDGVILAESIRPMDTLLQQGKKRQRVRKSETQEDTLPKKPFKWGDER
ncbi:MAG TPA: helix-turn-helix transcriptional regulator [Sphaerochaeta sp.]|nr:helix-turn-helix transcriptional regulator [Sphaerochaeta sp.]